MKLKESIKNLWKNYKIGIIVGILYACINLFWLAIPLAYDVKFNPILLFPYTLAGIIMSPTAPLLSGQSISVLKFFEHIFQVLMVFLSIAIPVLSNT